MAHVIATIYGSKETAGPIVPGELRSKVTHKNQEMVLTAFYGGKDCGMSLQISIGKEYVQLSNAQITEMVRAILLTIDLKESFL